MKLKFALAAYAAALAFGVSAQAATLDVKTATNPAQAKMQVDAEKATGNISNAKYRGHEGVDQLQASNNGHQYGAGMLKAKWTDDGQAKKVLTAEAKKPTLIALDAKKPFAHAANDKAPTHYLAGTTSDKADFNLSQAVVTGSSQQMASGLVLIGAKGAGIGGLTIGNIGLKT